MSNNDVAEIQVTLKNIGVTATPEQIENKLKTLAGFNVTGAEAKRNATRSRPSIFGPALSRQRKKQLYCLVGISA